MKKEKRLLRQAERRTAEGQELRAAAPRAAESAAPAERTSPAAAAPIVPPSAARSEPRLPPVAPAASVSAISQRVPPRPQGNALPPRSNLRWIVVSVGALIALGLLWKSFQGARKEPRGLGAPESPEMAGGGPFPNFLAAPGLVEAASGVRHLAFEMSGKIKRVAVEEGETVKAKQPIAELENGEQEARLQAAMADLKVTEAQFKVLERDLDAQLVRAEKEAERLQAEVAQMEAGPREEEIAVVRAEVKAGEVEVRRRTEDAAKYQDLKVSSRQEKDQAERMAEIATAQLQAANARLRQLEAGYRKEEIAKSRALRDGALTEVARCKSTKEPRLDAARSQVEQAKSKVQLAQVDLARTKIDAPVDGVVVWKYRHQGETVGVLPPDVVVAVADCVQLRVRADVDESDFARVKVGQKVKVRAAGMEGTLLAGSVERVSQAAGQKRFSTGEAKERMDVKVVETLVRFDQPPPLKLGLRVTVFFELPKAEAR